MEYYRPTAIVLQCGADSLGCDRLGCFNLSIKAHGACVEYTKTFNVPLLVLGGGGYTIRNVSRCWAYETSVLLDTQLSNELPYNAYYEYFGPDYQLHPNLAYGHREITNQNTRPYLESLRKRVVEHLRLLQAAPSVQMQEIPPDLLGVVEGSIMDDMDRELEAMERDDEEDRRDDEKLRRRDEEMRVDVENEYFDNDRDQERGGDGQPDDRQQVHQPSQPQPQPTLPLPLQTSSSSALSSSLARKNGSPTSSSMLFQRYVDRKDNDNDGDNDNDNDNDIDDDEADEEDDSMDVEQEKMEPHSADHHRRRERTPLMERPPPVAMTPEEEQELDSVLEEAEEASKRQRQRQRQQDEEDDEIIDVGGNTPRHSPNKSPMQVKVEEEEAEADHDEEANDDDDQDIDVGGTTPPDPTREQQEGREEDDDEVDVDVDGITPGQTPILPPSMPAYDDDDDDGTASVEKEEAAGEEGEAERMDVDVVNSTPQLSAESLEDGLDVEVKEEVTVAKPAMFVKLVKATDLPDRVMEADDDNDDDEDEVME